MRVALVPGVLALLPRYAGIEDPVVQLRAACLAAVGWLGRDVEVLADAQGGRVAAYLLDATERADAVASLLVVANGSACRSERAPGHLDERAGAFDLDLGRWLRGEGPPVEATLGTELLASMTGFVGLAHRVPSLGVPQVDYDDDPFGVQYWVMRWTCES